MGLGLLFDPSALFISEEDWQDENVKDLFLNGLLETLKQIDDLKLNKIIWSEPLENLFWNDPQLNPWKHYGNFKLSIIPIIYHKFNGNYMVIDVLDSIATYNPELKCHNELKNVKDEFLKLSDTLVSNDIEFNLFLSHSNSRIEELNITSNDQKTYSPVIFKNKYDYCNCIEFDKHFWPSSTEKKEIEKFEKALELARMANFHEEHFKYNYIFQKPFIKDIIDIDESQRRNLVEKIVKRLCSDRKTASEDSSLRDEFISQAKEYIFRVTQRPTSTRIHYTYTDDGSINFKRFYGPGEHDDGL